MTKLADWKINQLSFARRITLAKSVLEAVPIYHILIKKTLHKACIEDIYRLQMNFVWRDT